MKPRFVEDPSMSAQYTWEIDSATVETWLQEELEVTGIDITQELNYSLLPNSPLRQILWRFSGSA